LGSVFFTDWLITRNWFAFDYHPRDVRRHRVLEQPGVAGDFHGHLIRRSQPRYELVQLLQPPRAQKLPAVFQPRTAREHSPMQIDSEVSLLAHLLLLWFSSLQAE
jgi:hypothetical protein